ncbi:MAG: SCP2 sterol-binding domain-containing protein, partial [Roseburia sp.]|nr:SCP2 sterol-binding domain-containing protein [Roseburia sp.]
VKQRVLRTQQMELTPQESEQLSKYVSDDSYVKKQKEDIEELASLFKDKMDKKNEEKGREYIEDFQSHFVEQNDFHARYLFMIEGKDKPLFVEVKDENLEIHYGQEDNIDVYAKLSPDVLEGVISGRMTFQRAFMTGEMTAKGNFKILRTLDAAFNFA